MRVVAPFHVLLACLAIALFPACSVARTHAKPAAERRRVSSRRAAASKVAVHKAAVRREPHARSAENRPRHARLAVRKAKDDRATTARIHAWVKSQKHSDVQAGSATQTLPGHAQTSPDLGDRPSDSSAAQPVSVISTVRTADNVLDKPQLPPVADLAAEPILLPTLYNKRGRLVVPPPLKGSHEILIRQNVMADSDGLDRVRDDDDLDRMRRAGSLVAIPNSTTLRVDDRLPGNRRYCRPWTALFLDTLARQHYARFQTALQVNSAVRTVEFQQRLIHTNGNAAPADGDAASPHLTGQAVDIAKRGLSMAEIAWLRGYLLPLVQQGKVDVEEEFQQSCFHISVYRKYMPSPAVRRVIATTHREGVSALATALR